MESTNDAKIAIPPSNQWPGAMARARKVLACNEGAIADVSKAPSPHVYWARRFISRNCCAPVRRGPSVGKKVKLANLPRRQRPTTCRTPRHGPER